jgi:hypothetical protein
MSQAPAAGGHETRFLATYRTDTWWVLPLFTVIGLGFFAAWSGFRAFEGDWYTAGPYVSPYLTPALFSNPSALHGPHASETWFGDFPKWWPYFLASPALFAVPFPTMFRGTCYYYRKAYYRSFFGWPPACAVGPMHYGRYEGETSLLLFQNLHRYTLYIAILLIPLLYIEAFHGLRYEGHWGIGLGTVLQFSNATLLSMYTFGCHSWRHLVGGRLDCFSCDAQSTVRGRIWERVSWLNARHQMFAWLSLFCFLFTDIYIFSCSHGWITDLNTWSNF